MPVGCTVNGKTVWSWLPEERGDREYEEKMMAKGLESFYDSAPCDVEPPEDDHIFPLEREAEELKEKIAAERKKLRELERELDGLKCPKCGRPVRDKTTPAPKPIPLPNIPDPWKPGSPWVDPGLPEDPWRRPRITYGAPYFTTYEYTTGGAVEKRIPINATSSGG